eukprot:4888403-Alexandrium_andersonii.AAC.1
MSEEAEAQPALRQRTLHSYFRYEGSSGALRRSAARQRECHVEVGGWIAEGSGGGDPGGVRLFGGLQAQHSLDALPMAVGPEEEALEEDGSGVATRWELKVHVPEDWIPEDGCAFVNIFYGRNP